jgi:hypothetical protein
MNPEDDRLAAQSALYDEVINSPVTDHAIDFLCRTKMLLRITDDQHEPVLPVLHTAAGRQAALREYKQLSDDEHAELLELVSQHWSLNVNLAVRKMWHAAEVLGFRGDTLDPKHVAMVAATYFSLDTDDLIDQLEQLTK